LKKFYIIMTIIGIVIPLAWWYFAGMPGLEEPTEGEKPVIKIETAWFETADPSYIGFKLFCNDSYDPDGDIVKIEWYIPERNETNATHDGLTDAKIATNGELYDFSWTVKKSDLPKDVTFMCWDNDGNKASKTITVHNPF